MKKRRANESFPQWVDRNVPELPERTRGLIKEMIKAAWLDGVQFERRIHGDNGI